MLPNIIAESVAGCVGGVCKSAALYPLDLATTRRELGLAAFEDGAPLVERYYRGLGVCILLLPLYAVVFHGAYVASSANDLVGSTLGSLAASVVGAPSECAKKRVQLGAAPTAALAGGRSLFDGYGAILVRNVPYNAVNFCAFRLLRGPPALRGFLAGCLTAVVTHPIDVALTRIQTARHRDLSPEPALRTLRHVFAARTFFRGLLVRLLNYAPASLIFFAVFDPTRHFLLRLLLS
mmetsp:Transcript_2812/g.9405  ORF Transcript_2812/g.9405 Transcript_2812/m.9405 type:complete len:236 (+) Transcript_2812:225-932(+)